MSSTARGSKRKIVVKGEIVRTEFVEAEDDDTPIEWGYVDEESSESGG